MAYFVYILSSKKDYQLYTGSTNNIKQRLTKHNNGEVKATRHRRPLQLIYQERYKTKYEAHKREYFLKTKWGNTVKQRIRKHYVERIQQSKS